jgi:hypothetical protein
MSDHISNVKPTIGSSPVNYRLGLYLSRLRIPREAYFALEADWSLVDDFDAHHLGDVF